MGKNNEDNDIQSNRKSRNKSIVIQDTNNLTLIQKDKHYTDIPNDQSQEGNANVIVYPKLNFVEKKHLSNGIN